MIRIDMAIKLMLGKIPVKRKDPLFLIEAINIIRSEKRLLLSFYQKLCEEDKLLFTNDIANYNNAINNYKPLFI